jgi:benzodiazapine receptor
MTFRSALRLIGCLLLCVGIGLIAGLATAPEIPTWYAGLVKPSWTPPPAAFPVVWTILYILMAVALWRLWDRTPASALRTRAIVFFLLQLALNAIWSPIFFGLHGIRSALAVIALLLIAIVATMMASVRVDRIAAWLLVPYLLWVAYASTIDAGVVWLN